MEITKKELKAGVDIRCKRAPSGKIECESLLWGKGDVPAISARSPWRYTDINSLHKHIDKQLVTHKMTDVCVIYEKKKVYWISDTRHLYGSMTTTDVVAAAESARDYGDDTLFDRVTRSGYEWSGTEWTLVFGKGI